MSNDDDDGGQTFSTGLPARVFLFTLDQIAQMINVGERTLKNDYIHFAERTPGARPKRKMMARNIAPEDVSPDWRVTEEEFKRWMRHMGYRLYEVGRVR